MSQTLYVVFVSYHGDERTPIKEEHKTVQSIRTMNEELVVERCYNTQYDHSCLPEQSVCEVVLLSVLFCVLFYLLLVCLLTCNVCVFV